jgi:uncharacterized protein (TIGR02147 family)
MVNIFDYIDYREYLKACFDEIQNSKAAIGIKYSYEAFANLLRINNRSYLWDVMSSKKKKQLADKYWDGVSQGLKHTSEQSKYLKNIITYTHAKEKGKQVLADYYYEQAMSSKSKSTTPAFQLRKDQFEYLTQWYHSAIRALIGMNSFDGDFKRLSKTLAPPISETQAKKSVQLLERLDLIVKGNDGAYCITKKKIKVGEDIPQMTRNRYHTKHTELAGFSIMEHSPETHDISSLTLGISKDTFEMIRHETKHFKEKITELTQNENNADRVYQFQLLLFPLTNNEEREK